MQILLTKVLTAFPHHFHSLVAPSVALVVVVKAAEEETLESHLGE